MSKHTSGPWQPWNAEFNPALIVANVDLGPDGEFRCDTICEVSEEPRDWVANARLIAAAPELYASLVELLDVYSRPDRQICCSGHDCGCMGATVQQEAEHFARLAIAKAEGRT